MIHVANTNLRIEFEHVNMLKIQSVWNLSDTFAFILPQNYQYWFLLMLRTSSAEVRKKTLQGNTNCSAPDTVTQTKVANERYLSYLQLC